MKIKEIKIREDDGSYSDPIPVGVDFVNVDTTNGSNLKIDLDNINKDLDNLQNKDINLQNQINGLASGSPAGVYTTLNDLQNANPDHSKIYVVLSDGHWYYFDDSWKSGGVYQAQINDNIINGLIKQNGVKLYGLGSYNSSNHDFISQNAQGVDVRYGICLYADGRRPFSLGFNNTNGDLFNVRVRKSDGTQLFQTNRCTAIEYTNTDNDIIYIEIWKGTDPWSTVYDETFLNNFKYKYFNQLVDSLTLSPTFPTVLGTDGNYVESQAGNWASYHISVPDNTIIRVFGLGANAYPTVAYLNNGALGNIIFNVGQFGEAINKCFYFEKSCDIVVQLYTYSDETRVTTPYVKMTTENKGFEGKVLSVIGDSYVANNGQPQDYTWHYKLANALKMQYNNYGINGDGLVGVRSDLTPVKDRLSSIYKNSNYILVVGGENDANIKLDIDTFKLGIEDIIKNLYNNFRNAKIGFVTPWGDGLSSRTFIKPYADAIKEVCDKFGVPVFDAWNNYLPSFNEKERTLYYQGPNDSSHLNFTGHQCFVSKIENWFKSL